jgi:hypothetical protein
MNTPETEQQAQSWQQVVKHGHAAGLCYPCASQLAWGVQNGFATVRTPCVDCAPLVETWAVKRPSGWRTPTGTLSRPPAWAAHTSDEAESAGSGRELRRSSTVDEKLRECDG